MKSHVIFLTLFLLSCTSAIAQLGINTDNSAPDNSSMLDVKSTTRGMLVPRMSAAQRDAIVNPASGLLIFCTDNNLYYSNKGTPATPNWLMVNSKWLPSGSNIYFSSGNVGIGTTTPATKLEIAGGNWDVINGEGDFRIGNGTFRIKIGVATAGGGAGAVGIMQYGQPGGYNVLKIGAQGNYLLFINGASQKVGIGTDSPLASFDVHGTFALVDGTQGSGKVLKSDAGGVASWVTEGTASTHFISESFGGGIVFYVYDGGRHGLIAATSNQSAGVQWYNGTFLIVNAARDGYGAGMPDTERIIAKQGQGNYAAEICANYQGGNFGDWYLPSKYELNLLYLQQATVGGFAGGTYWSSTEASEGFAWQQFFNTGSTYDGIKSGAQGVRAIRAF